MNDIEKLNKAFFELSIIVDKVKKGDAGCKWTGNTVKFETECGYSHIGFAYKFNYCPFCGELLYFDEE